MRDSERLIIALGGIDDDIIENTARFLGYEKTSKSGFSRRIIAIALAAALVLSLGIVAYATGFFGLRGRIVKDTRDNTPVNTIAPAESSTEPENGWIAPNGYADSPEAQAFAKWSTYYNENAAKYAVNNEPLRDHYAGFYGAFNDIMREELLSIADEYGLELHSERRTPMTNDEFYEITGISSPFIKKDNVYWQCIYIYEDGSFHIDGRTEIDGEELGFQIILSFKGTLAASGLYVRGLDYEEWILPLGDTTLELALKNTEFGSRGFIMFTGENNFITINVTTNACTIGKTHLDTLAEIIDYEALASASAEPVFPSEEAHVAEAEAGLLTVETLMSSPEYVASVAFQRAFNEWYDENGRISAKNRDNGYTAGQYDKGYYGSFPCGKGDLDELMASLEKEYSLTAPSSVKAIFNGSWIDPAVILEAPIWFEKRPELLGTAGANEGWDMIGCEAFLDYEPSCFICWDNGAWRVDNVIFVPYGCINPVLRAIQDPTANCWPYDTACGAQVLICESGDYVYPELSESHILYDTGTGYVVIASGYGVDDNEAEILQHFADKIDFTKIH